VKPQIRHTRALTGLLLITLLGVGLLIWPPPKEALAVDTTFRARVDWNGHPRNDNGIRLRLITRAGIGNPVLDNRVMAVAQNLEGISFFQVAFDPDDRARVWEVQIENIRTHTWVPTNLVIHGTGEMLAGMVSELNAAFICIDQ